jgi:hypothetical protein
VLKIYDNYDPSISFDFRLSKVEYQGEWVFVLNSLSIPTYEMKFRLPHEIDSFHDGYSTSVYLIKNKYFAQKDVIEIRVDEISENKGRIGYIVQLNSIFDEKLISVNKHLFSFYYYALGNIFYNLDFKQNKKPDFSKTLFDISDFFDDDILLLITCDQDTNKIPDFKIESYLPSLYKYGFYMANESSIYSFHNTSSEIQGNYLSLSYNISRVGYFSLKIDKVADVIANEDYLYGLFNKQLLKKSDQETRFLILYQVIEILISKILTIELTKKICGAIVPIEAFKLKSAIEEEVRENTRISYLFNRYTILSHTIKEDLKREIYLLLQYLQFDDFKTAYISSLINFNDVFYIYRNKLVHNHRSFKNSTLNEHDIQLRMEKINSLAELIVIEIVNTFHV